MKPEKNSARVRGKLIRTAVLLASLVLLLLPSVARSQQVAAPKRILVLYWYSKVWPPNAVFEQNIQAVLRSAPVGSVEYFPEYLEANRFPGNNQEVALRDFLRLKYAQRPIDVVVAFPDGPLNFLLKYRNELFPQAPIVFSAVNPPTSKEIAAEPGMTGIIHIYSFRQTLDLALRLHPGTEQVFIVSGTFEHDKTYEDMGRKTLQGYESRVKITHLTDLSPHELIDRMKSL